MSRKKYTLFTVAEILIAFSTLILSCFLSYFAGLYVGESNVKNRLRISYDAYNIKVRDDWFNKCKELDYTTPTSGTTRTKYQCRGIIVFVDQINSKYDMEYDK